jgi:protein-L-isoaspartate(D-aspartate) O-methyltransferase
LLRLGTTNVAVHHADGSQGWPEQAPYDAIVVAATAPRTSVIAICSPRCRP